MRMKEDDALPPRRVLEGHLEGHCRSSSVRAQQVHHAMTDSSFGALRWLPGFAVPARLAQGAHDAMSHGLHAAFRQSWASWFSWAGQTEDWLAAALSGLSPADEGVGLPAASVSLPPVPMGLHAQGRPLVLSTSALSGLKERLCIFLHGMACDEHSWQLDLGAWSPAAGSGGPAPFRPARERIAAHDYGTQLSTDFDDVSVVYLRYDSGAALEDSARRLSALLARLQRHAPSRLREVVLIGHSMGGLLALQACEQAARDGQAWAAMTRMLICLGLPQRGALPARRAEASSAAGVPTPANDAHRRASHPARQSNSKRQPALRLVAGNLADSAAGHLLGHLFGDGLVSSRQGTPATPDCDVEHVELPGLNHMALLNHPRVYALIKDWLQSLQGEAPRKSSSGRGR